MTDFDILEMYAKNRIPSFEKSSRGHWIMCGDTTCGECECKSICSTNADDGRFRVPKFTVEEFSLIRKDHPEYFL